MVVLGGGNMMWALFISKPTETTNYDVCAMRGYRLNILQWEEKSKECMKIPTGDYSNSVLRDDTGF